MDCYAVLVFLFFVFCLFLVHYCRIILYAIAMADYDQTDLEACKDVLKTKDGIERLALYNKSVGRLKPHTLCIFGFQFD